MEAWQLSSNQAHTTKSIRAYEPPHSDIGPGWLLLVAGLVVVALTSLSVRPVCRPDGTGVDESGFGVRHEKRGAIWYHCEPWIRRKLTD